MPRIRGFGVNCLTQCEAAHLHNGHNICDLPPALSTGLGRVFTFSSELCSRESACDDRRALRSLCHGSPWYAAVLDEDAFRAQTARLFLVLGGELLEHDAAARTDDAMPWNMQLFGRDLHGKSRLARAARKTRRPRNRSVGGCLTARNGAHHMPYRLQRRIFLLRRRSRRAQAFYGRRPKQRVECFFFARTQCSAPSIRAARYE